MDPKNWGMMTVNSGEKDLRKTVRRNNTQEDSRGEKEEKKTEINIHH